ncbi:MAG: CocE/NonD family hydrolase, partial [Dokdonella sp.]
VDVRGRGNSAGEFTPFLQEAHDGHDVVEWLAKQPLCNGKVAMWGGSYAGYDQWAAAKELPTGLATIVPVASAKPGFDFPMRNNRFSPYDIQWITFTSGRAAQQSIFGDGAFWNANFTRWYKSGRAFRDLDRMVGNPSKDFQTWLDHPMQDAYWDHFSPTPEQYAKMDLPILSITGSYDADQPGALAFYNGHMRFGTASAKARHYLIIGPWDHPGTRTPRAEVGGLTFGPASLLDMNALHKAWYDWTLKSGTKPEFLKDKVAFYVVGEEAWRYAPTLAATTARTETWNLDSHGTTANDVFASGSLHKDQPGKGKPDSYVSDPLDQSALDWPESESGNLIDQTATVLDTRQLVYHTPVFAQDIDIAGSFKLSAWIAIDQKDADFDVDVYEIKADGSSVQLGGDTMRARYRESARVEKLVVPGAIEHYDFNAFTYLARRIAKGSRLRLTISSASSPNAERNFNGGGVVSDETAKDARTVTVTLYHDARHPSALVVPIAAKSSVP